MGSQKMTRVEQHDNPLLSIVIPVYKSESVIRRCIEAVVEHTKVPYEIVVVDDCSPDNSVDVINQNFEGFRLFRNESNGGFGATSNRGVSEAKGKYVCLLNSDAFVTQSWEDSLIKRLEQDDSCFAVGPAFLDEEGLVSEAGISLIEDGLTYAVGAGKKADDSTINFPRKVDYCSAACVIYRTEAFLELGGFDSVYGRAYSEDADLALKARAAGFNFWYEPSSLVVHIGNVSTSQTDLGDLPLRNRALFVQRWSEVIQARSGLANTPLNHSYAATLRDANMTFNVLVVADALPSQNDLRLEDLLAKYPNSRFALAAIGQDDELASYWRSRGVEVAPTGWRSGGWLPSRKHWATAVVLLDNSSSEVEEEVNESQPHAHVVASSDPSKELEVAGYVETL